MKKIIGYKGFDKNLKCRGFQYEIGKEFHMDGGIKCCERGFHLCTDPQDVFGYYPPGLGNRFCIVEGSGTSDADRDGSKIAVSDIKIIKELSLYELHIAIRKYLEEKTEKKQQKKIASTSGAASSASTSGRCSGALAVGSKAQATVAAQCVGVVVGCETRARGAVGSWLVLSEAHKDNDCKTIIDCVRCAKVDGKNLLADTWYMLKNGHFVQVEG